MEGAHTRHPRHAAAGPRHEGSGRRRCGGDPRPYAITYERMPRDWDAGAYERLSAPLEAMGREVVQRLELEGHETVLDAGCGTGRVTAVIAERLPRGRVI